MANKKCSFIAACKEYFGFLPGQKLMDFKHEIEKLTADDRAYLSKEFVKVGYDVIG